MSNRGIRQSEGFADPQEAADIAAWRSARCRHSLDRLVRAHRRLAYAAARVWTKDPERTEDLAQEAVIGMIRSIDTFEIGSGHSFASHCWMAARRAVSEAAPSILSIIDVPEYLWRKLRQENLDSRERDLLVAQIWGVLSIDAPVGDGERTLGEGIASSDPSPQSLLEHEDQAEDVRSRVELALDSLPPEDAAVFRRRRLAEDPEPVEKIAKDLSTSRERIRNIEARAVHFVRKALANPSPLQEAAA